MTVTPGFTILRTANVPIMRSVRGEPILAGKRIDRSKATDPGSDLRNRTYERSGNRFGGME